MTTNISLSEALQWLEHGDKKQIARQVGMDLSSFIKYLKGSYKKPKPKVDAAVLKKAIQNMRPALEQKRAFDMLQNTCKSFEVIKP